MTRRTTLTRRQARGILALIAHPTVEQAAASAGVSRGTVSRWLRLPVFRAALDRARRAGVSRAVAQLQRLTEKAALALEKVLDGGARATAKIAAARLVFEIAIKAGELEDIRHQVDELKRQAASAGNPQGRGGLFRVD